MITRRILKLLFAILLVQTGFAQENPYDSKIGEAISGSNWFEVRECYEQTSDSLSDYMRLFSGALLDHNFNNPTGAVEKIQQMYEQHGNQMGGNFFSLFCIMSDNLAKLGHFKSAHDICTSLLAQGRDHMDEGTRTAFETNAVLFGARSQWLKMQILDGERDYCIPFKVEKEQIQFTATHIKKPIKAMLDSGGQMTVIDKQLAIELGLPLSADSILFNDARCPLALLDTLQLGSATFVHIPCAVLSLQDAGVTDCNIILGNDILQLFAMMELDYKHQNLHLQSQSTDKPNAPHNLLMNKIPYIQVQLAGVPAILMWDTGGNKSSIEPQFYNKYSDRLLPLEAHGRRQAKTITGNNPTLEYAVLPQVEVVIAGKTGVIRTPYVIKDMPHLELMGIPFDGTLGVIPPSEFRRLTINFREMYFIAE